MMKRSVIISCLALLLCGCVSQQKDSEYVVGFYNLENLFVVYDDPARNDEDFLPDGRNSWTEDKYRKKLENMAQVISEMAKENGRW